MQWLMGLVIDIVKGMGHTEIFAFKSAFSVFLILSIISYIFFLILNRKNMKIKRRNFFGIIYWYCCYLLNRFNFLILFSKKFNVSS